MRVAVPDLASGMFACAAISLCAGARPTFAQTRPAASASSVVRIHAVDPESVGVDGVSIELRGDGGTLLVTVVTRADGRASVAVPGAQRPLRYITRRIGFAPASGVVLVAAHDTIDLEIRIERVPPTLDTVRTTDSRERILSNNYVLGSAEIARSGRYIVDAYDALRDLRPWMLGDDARLCPTVQNLWVNGQRQVIAAWEQLVPTHAMAGATRDDQSGRAALRGGVMAFHATENDPLGRISAAHIEEMRYVSCWQRSVVGAHGDNALFITLKPGVGFDMRRGSYVSDSAAARRAHAIP